MWGGGVGMRTERVKPPLGPWQQALGGELGHSGGGPAGARTGPSSRNQWRMRGSGTDGGSRLSATTVGEEPPSPATVCTQR